jgi:hypothetical protein
MDNEIEQLRREFDALPKTDPHGMEQQLRHPDIRPEWIMRIIKNPHESWVDRGHTILAGRVPEFSRWIKVVFIEDPEFGLFNTAYADRRLENYYGGRPWAGK